MKARKNHEPVSNWGPLVWLVTSMIIACAAWVGRARLMNPDVWYPRNWRDDFEGNDGNDDDEGVHDEEVSQTRALAHKFSRTCMNVTVSYMHIFD